MGMIIITFTYFKVGWGGSTEHIRKSEDSLWELVLSFNNVDPGDWIKAARLGDKHITCWVILSVQVCLKKNFHIYLFCTYVGVHRCHGIHVEEARGQLVGSSVSPFIMWILRIKIGLPAIAFTYWTSLLSHLVCFTTFFRWHVKNSAGYV